MQKNFSGLSGLGRNGRYAEMFRLQAQNYQDAKEIKLSHIEVPLEKQFHQAIDETIAVSKKYGVRISLWSLVNRITVFTFLSMFCVPLYLGYMALVACSIGLGDVAAQ